MKMKFKIGQVYRTSGIDHLINEHPSYIDELIKCFERYITMDFGDLGDEDIKANYDAIKYNERILGSYSTTNGKIYMITEADRATTTILLAEEYWNDRKREVYR